MAITQQHATDADDGHENASLPLLPLEGLRVTSVGTSVSTLIGAMVGVANGADEGINVGFEIGLLVTTAGAYTDGTRAVDPGTYTVAGKEGPYT